jgi:hypothetical protein
VVVEDEAVERKEALRVKAAFLGYKMARAV